MSTEFPTGFPLSDKSGVRYAKGGSVTDFAADGTPRYRQLTTKRPVMFKAVFTPMSASSSAFFEAVMVINHFGVETHMDHLNQRYTGYIDQASIKHNVKHGDLHYWSFTLICNSDAIPT